MIFTILTLLYLLCLAFLYFTFKNRFFNKMTHLTRKPWVPLLWITLFFVLILGMIYQWRGVPLPQSGDETSILTQAEIFSQGRLSDPSPQPSVSFESPHLLVDPFYASKYQPSQAFLLSLALRFNSPPILAVWIFQLISIPLLYFFARSLFQPPTSLIVALLGAAHVMINSSTQTYFSYIIPLIGGTLWFGSLFYYLFKNKNLLFAIPASIGFAFMFFSRPYETVIALGLGALLLLSQISLLKINRNDFLFLILLFLGGLSTGVAQVLYQYALTGDPFQLPYQLYEKIYSPRNHFFWSPAFDPTPVYQNPYFKFLYETWDSSFIKERGLLFILGCFFHRSLQFIQLLPNPFWILLLFLIPFMKFKIRFLKIILILSVWSLLFHLFPRWYFFHYSSCFLFLWILLATLLFRSFIRKQFLQKSSFYFLKQPLLVVLILSLILTPLWIYLKNPPTPSQIWWKQRATLIDQLARSSENHLIFVHYHPQAFHELSSGNPPLWVVNGADIPRQKIIFVHDLSPEINQQVIQNYPLRKLWKLSVLSDQDSLIEPLTHH